MKEWFFAQLRSWLRPYVSHDTLLRSAQVLVDRSTLAHNGKVIFYPVDPLSAQWFDRHHDTDTYWFDRDEAQPASAASWDCRVVVDERNAETLITHLEHEGLTVAERVSE